MSSSLTYYDPISGRKRIRHRVLWGIWGFAGGAVFGVLLVLLF